MINYLRWLIKKIDDNTIKRFLSMSGYPKKIIIACFFLYMISSNYLMSDNLLLFHKFPEMLNSRLKIETFKLKF